MNHEKLTGFALPIIQSYEIDPVQENWTFDTSTRFITTKAQAENQRLHEIISLLSTEFSTLGVPVTHACLKEETVSKADILITLAQDQYITDQSDSKEAYKIQIDSGGVSVTAASENAVLHALRTVQYLLITNEKTLAYGTIIDYPDLEERRLHVDMGRKYFTKDWMIEHIKELSYLKMNTLQLHFAENLGFRIECEIDPAIVSQDGFLTKVEVKEIITVAKKYGIKIIPSLDTPGHVEHILKTHPSFGQIDKHGNKSSVALDVTNRAAIDYMKDIYSEYMELFKDSTDFHIGADEYMEFDRPPFTTDYKEVLDQYAITTLGEGFTWKDVIANYINEIAAHVNAGGFKPRIFNDGVYYGEKDADEPSQQVKMHDYIGVDFWSQMGWNPSIAPLDTFIEKEHQAIYNLNANYFYYVLRNDIPEDGRAQHSFDHHKADEKIYNEWRPGMFDRNTLEDRSKYIKGAQLSVWCDNPTIVSEDQITKDIAKELRAFATKTWNITSDEVIDYNTFVKSYETLENIRKSE